MLLLWFLLWVQAAWATPAVAPTASSAPVDALIRSDIPAPPGGWWTEDGAWLRVHGAPNDRVTVERLAQHGNRSLPALAERLQVPVGAQVEIYLAPDERMFNEIQPGHPPDWADGTAWPSLGLIFLHAPSARPGTARPLEQVLDHELVHILVGRAFAPRVPPRWLQEGLAEYYSGEFGPNHVREILSFLPTSGLMPFATLSGGFPTDPMRAQLAYAQSVDLILFIADEYGEQSLAKLLDSASKGASMGWALREATGEDITTLERQWQARWSDPWVRWSVLMTDTTFWGIAVLISFVAAWKIRRRNHHKLRRWAEEEAAHYVN